LDEAFKVANDDKTHGYVRSPLTGIPFNRVVVDLLHLFLRGTDRLEDLLIDVLSVADGADKPGIGFENKQLLKRYFDKLKELNISSPFYM
jgi:hypothetical protein